jgi:hypothetical protein
MKKAMVFALALSGLIYVLVGSSEDRSTPPDTAGDADLIADRLWVDSKPERYTDYVNALVVIEDVPLGLFQKASAYHMVLEVFEYKRAGNRVALEFPQSNTKRRFRYTITSCDDLPPFDLCLTVSENPWGGPKRYYSTRDGNAATPELGALESRIRARLDRAAAR